MCGTKILACIQPLARAKGETTHSLLVFYNHSNNQVENKSKEGALIKQFINKDNDSSFFCFCVR